MISKIDRIRRKSVENRLKSTGSALVKVKVRYNKKLNEFMDVVLDEMLK